MAELGISIADKLIEILKSPLIHNICDAWNYKSQLEALKNTVSTVKSVLRDAEAKRDLTDEAQTYVAKLKDAVYDADDLFDEFLTLAELKQLRPDSKHGKFFGKVSSFFSSKNQVSVAYRMSRQVKDIRKSLDSIATEHKKFGFSVDYKPIIRRREETCSYVDAKEIIGRDNDKNLVLDMLLDPNVDDDVQFLSIVGVGGLGKTALAQLVFNDEKVVREFPELRLWVCVSDQDGETFDVKKILCKILAQVGIDSASEMEIVQNRFREHFRDRKYLLVLDDVWNEDRSKWVNMQRFLVLGQRGSRVMVTTRSKKTAIIIGDAHTHNLGGLSPQSCWQLFEVTAFKGGVEQIDNEFVKIGEKIVKKCCNIPLAIKVVGSLLYEEEIHKWRSFEESGLTGIGNGDNDIMSILKLSYHNLNSSLKSCFIYCSLFPKDTRLRKDLVISYWMAQGYVVPLDVGQSREEAAKEYFLILLRRCFFQDVVKNMYGEILSVKIHDLMHDVAQEVTREEICMLSSSKISGDKILHVYYCGDQSLESFSNSKIRTFVDMHHTKPVLITKLDTYRCLRVLDLRNFKFGDMSLLHSIGSLLHLRYLKLSDEKDLKVLPDSITKLHNLETLILRGCRNLREFPEHFSRLTKLRHLDLGWCGELRSMPLGMDKLTSLRVLPFFMVGKREAISNEKPCNYGELKDLLALTNLEGTIRIKINDNRCSVEEGNLKAMKHLTAVEIEFASMNDDCEDSEILIKKLEPHSGIKGFILRSYKGKTIPRWGREENNWAFSLPHLVHIELGSCEELEQMPVLSKLRHLKSLKLWGLRKLEYMENAISISSVNTEAAESMTFFPNLEYLKLNQLERLKGWWRGEGSVERKNRFPRLSELGITFCGNLTSFPPCPRLERLTLWENHENLRIVENIKEKEEDEVRLKIVDMDGEVGFLKSISLPCLTSLSVSFKDVGKSSDGGEVFQSHASSLDSLRELTIKEWYFTRKHSSLSGLGLEHLTTLEKLVFTFMKSSKSKVECEDEDDDDNDDDDNDEGMPWKSLNQSLCYLSFVMHSEIRRLPRGIQYLTSLQNLQLSLCDRLESLPEWIDCLSSLRSLSIDSCRALKSLPGSIQNLNLLQRLEIHWCGKELEERCKEQSGEDWPKIQHIPLIQIGFNKL